MPNPISNTTPSTERYSSLAESSSCDPTVASCAPPEPPAGGERTPAVLDLEPVYVVGELGTRSLVEKYEQRGGAAPDCSEQTRTAVISCVGMVGGVLAGMASAGTVIGAVGGATCAFTAAVGCGRDLALLDACENQ